MSDSAAFAEKYGPWAVVVGGSEGIGSAFANELAHRGVNPVLVARTQSTLDEAAEQIRAANPGVEVRTVSVDLSVPEGAEQVIAATEGLEVGTLVYNVGSEPKYGEFIDHDWDMLAGRLQRNFVSKARLVHHFAGLMAPRERGALVLMGSVAGFGGSPGFALYAASKAFSHTLGEGLWFELSKHGIDVLTPVVGQTNTPDDGQGIRTRRRCSRPGRHRPAGARPRWPTVRCGSRTRSASSSPAASAPNRPNASGPSASAPPAWRPATPSG